MSSKEVYSKGYTFFKVLFRLKLTTLQKHRLDGFKKITAFLRRQNELKS